MFERYTEKARRVIFFARYEASHFGSPVIDTEHLLLGILREDKRVSLMVLPVGAGESIRAQVETRTPQRAIIPTSVDLPLSDSAKRVLKYGAEEADRMNHRHIGCDHLFLGLLREQGCFAEQLLLGFGANLEVLRKKFSEATQDQTIYQVPPGQGRLTISSKTIQLHGKAWNPEYLRQAIHRLHEFNWDWHNAAWKATDVLVNRNTGKISFDLNLAGDTNNFELLKGGWKKDYCAICRWELFESEDDHGRGYTNGREWICTECYERFWDRPDFISGSYSDLT